jgi:cadmium resistance protein CadD (predicted permease)
LPDARQELISIFSAVITGIVTFAATNVDDLFILRLFFSQTDAAFP